ncbi:MAG: LysR family transcriptional regulator, partial [Sphingomonadales bacterium]
LNFNHLRYFWAVAHEGNLSRTADHLGVSQSALSIQIKKLEEQIGHALFERQGRRLVLTEAGKIALDYADSIFETGEELLSTLSSEGGAARRVLRIGSLATLSRNFQIAFLRPLVGREDVEIVVRSGAERELMGELEAHRIDVLLSNAPAPRDASHPWISHLMAEQPVSLVGLPKLVGRRPVLEKLIAERPLILPTAGTSIRLGFDALVDRLGVRPQVAAEVDDMATIRLLAREGAGLAVVPPIVVENELSTGLLKEAIKLPRLVETFYAITPSRRFPNPVLRTLVESRELSLG